MRVAIREQLALLILLASLIGLGVLSIATWVSNHSFVLSVCKARLTLTASLKAGQLTSNLNLMQTTTSLIGTRVIMQAALKRYNDNGNNTADNWSAANADLATVIGSSGSLGQTLLLQSVVFPRNAQGPAGSSPVLNTTSPAVDNSLELPLVCPNGMHAKLGMDSTQCGGLSYGYPPPLYPNFTYVNGTNSAQSAIPQIEYEGDIIGPLGRSALLIGPWEVNKTFSLVSLTLPIIDNGSTYDVLGWLTVVMDALLIRQVLDSTEGLEQTGETLLVGPVSNSNIFPSGIMYNTNHGNPPNDFKVKFVVPLNTSDASRHPDHVLGSANPPFEIDKYAALEQAITTKSGNLDNSGAVIRASNEAGQRVALGYAMPQSTLVNWVVVVEQARSEVWQPINHLRDIILGCVFATAGFMFILAFPLAHFAVLPIRRLREATAKSMEPPGNSEASRSSLDSFEDGNQRELEDANENDAADGAAKEDPNNPVSKWRQKRQQDREFRREQRQKRAFRIPGKVPERKHLVKDELSDLTTTFNEMSDELMMQYSRLEERVRQRTSELEQSKKAAEAANESKTLFIANISHELKTPLNGILGMCAVCMQEEDPVRLKRSLGIIYKSGDLLLNLLTDLLTFSKNQVGQQLALTETEFRLRDVSSQILAVFDKQAQEGQIDLRVQWEGITLASMDDSLPERTDLGPSGTGRLKDMILWGDMQRILQVIINLVSNALKFTPSGGSVLLTIRCLPELANMSRKTSKASRQSRQSRQVSSRAHGSDPSITGIKIDTANAINAKDRPHAMHSYDRTASPPPGIFLDFEFEVTDTGPGIPENLQAKIFEPFVQGDLGLSKKFGGTGLGLSICSQLAGLMQGTMQVQSTVGWGSSFTLHIPIRHLKSRADSSASSRIDLDREPVSHKGSFDDGEKVPARHSRLAAEEHHDHAAAPGSGSASPAKLTNESQPRLVGLSQPFFASSQPMESPGSQPAAMQKMADEASRSGNRIRVLVAEDNKVNQEVVTRMLRLEDVYDVTVAKDGQEALDYVKESMAPPTPGGTKDCQPFNLIFMDVQMPNVDGLQSTRLIREIGYEAPIVALTAFAEESNIKDCMESGMNYFLSKPIKRPQLKKVLKEYCAPIPEENEETPPEVGTTSETPMGIVVVANTGTMHQPSVQQTGPAREEITFKRPTLIDAGITRSESPVSPMTNT